MNDEDVWTRTLQHHPIFTRHKTFEELSGNPDWSLELSTKSLPVFTTTDVHQDRPTPSGRRRTMALKDADLVVAVGKEIRMTTLGVPKLGHRTVNSYKILHTPNIQFEIHQMELNPNGKLLAVAGAFQVAVVVLPRTGFMRLVPGHVDCKSIQVGQYYHASRTSAPVAKIEWHPWGEGGSTLMVMTVDGKLREYDISIDPEEPQQVLSFVAERKFTSYTAEDASEREVASFAIGKGKADWGPLTVYAVTRSGDVYAICPYLPRNASVPSSYVHTLECFISAKQEYLAQNPLAAKQLSLLYDYQHKYINALLKQLPPGTVFPAASRSVPLHPPSTIKAQPLRQGPFLLQPSPHSLQGSEGGDATDMMYLAFGSGSEDGEGETERLGVILLAFQDGKVDVCLDVDKVEARWESRRERVDDLPMLTVYETIDLGLVSMLSQSSESSPLLDLLQGNYVAFLPDPIHDDTVYVSHAFGVHTLVLGPVLQGLAAALREEDDSDGKLLAAAVQDSDGSEVHSILTTFSVERKCSNPVVAIVVPDDVYLTYGILILTSSMRVAFFPLDLRSEPQGTPERQSTPSVDKEGFEKWLVPTKDPTPYVSLLNEPFSPPAALSRPLGLPSNPRLATPPDTKAEFMLTPDTLRYLGKIVERFTAQIRDIQLANGAAEARAELQQQEFARQEAKHAEMVEMIQRLTGQRQTAFRERLRRIQERQSNLLARFDRILQVMIAKASPELSEHETKWFEELRGMKEEVTGAGRWDEGSLVTRTKMLEREFNRILPSLKLAEEKVNQRKGMKNQELGFSQAFELGELSTFERSRIRELEKEVTTLAAKFDLDLDRPPEP